MGRHEHGALYVKQCWHAMDTAAAHMRMGGATGRIVGRRIAVLGQHPSPAATRITLSAEIVRATTRRSSSRRAKRATCTSEIRLTTRIRGTKG